MFPFPQAPYGGTGGMTSNQMRQPMQQPAPQNMQVQQAQNGTQLNTYGAGGPRQLPQVQSFDPRQLAALRAILQQRQQQPGNNLRSLLGL